MKINEKTHPVLGMIKKSYIDRLYCNKSDSDKLQQYKPMIDGLWSAIVPDIEKNVKYLTSPFMDAIALSCQKMLNLELVKTLFQEEKYGVIISKAMTICYWIMPKPTGGFNAVYFRFVNTSYDQVALDAQYNMSVDGEMKGKTQCYFSSERTESRELKDVLKKENDAFFAMLNFIKYAEVEIKILQPKKKEYIANCKYENDTNKAITILDSKWFTTLVKSDAFKVRGHFRLQPYGEGMKLKKLIWINDFEKTGYTAPARKLKED